MLVPEAMFVFRLWPRGSPSFSASVKSSELALWEGEGAHPQIKAQRPRRKGRSQTQREGRAGTGADARAGFPQGRPAFRAGRSTLELRSHVSGLLWDFSPSGHRGSRRRGGCGSLRHLSSLPPSTQTLACRPESNQSPRREQGEGVQGTGAGSRTDVCYSEHRYLMLQSGSTRAKTD